MYTETTAVISRKHAELCQGKKEENASQDANNINNLTTTSLEENTEWLLIAQQR